MTEIDGKEFPFYTGKIPLIEVVFRRSSVPYVLKLSFLKLIEKHSMFFYFTGTIGEKLNLSQPLKGSIIRYNNADYRRNPLCF